jgi:hypothetical protein
MEATTPQEVEEPLPPRDLRAELFLDLSTHFSTVLDSDASLPTSARAGLVAVLALDAPTAAEIIAAASKNGPVETEMVDE